mmetsp:Transcript_55955/g.147973  ORF Transcript_55955/g.147973 Transcript_55955/m.147973 type:complete len:523 (-) Transcript_55955:150-1718(-)
MDKKEEKNWWDAESDEDDNKDKGFDDIFQEVQVATTRLLDATSSILLDAAGGMFMPFVKPAKEYQPEISEEAGAATTSVLKKPAKIREEAENRNKQLLEAAFHGTLHLYVDYAGEYKHLTDNDYRLRNRLEDLKARLQKKYPPGSYKMLGKGKYEILPIYDSKKKKILEDQRRPDQPEPEKAKSKSEELEVAKRNIAKQAAHERVLKRFDKIKYDQKDPKKAEAMRVELTELRRELKDLESTSTVMRGNKSVRDPDSDPKEPKALARGDIPRIERRLDQLKTEKFPTSKTILETLKDAGADIDYQNEDGYTALMFAARNGHARTVEALLNIKADVTRRNKLGRTALHYAAQFAHKDIVVLLRQEKETDRKVGDCLGKTPRALAEEERKDMLEHKTEQWKEQVYKERMFLKVDPIGKSDEPEGGAVAELYFHAFKMKNPEAVEPAKEWKPDTWRISKIPDPACRVDPMSEQRYLSRWESTAKRLGPPVKTVVAPPTIDAKYLAGAGEVVSEEDRKLFKALISS